MLSKNALEFGRDSITITSYDSGKKCTIVKGITFGVRQTLVLS